ncbi:hypothetical protein [Mesorhizobium amorphae]
MALADKIPVWLKAAIISTISFGAGFVTNYYVDYRNNYVIALNTNYDQFDKASEDIRNTLKIFADIAKGDKPRTDEDVSSLQMKLLKAVGQVEDLSRRVDGGSLFVKNYQDAAVNLNNAAQKIKGPSNGKEMVLAVNDFLLAESNVRDAVLKESNSFLW